MSQFRTARTLICSALILAATAVTLASPTSPSEVSSAPTMELLGVIRDFPPESAHADFTTHPSATPGARSSRNIALNLDTDKKPSYVGGGKRVNQEFRDAAGNKIAWCVPAAPGDSPGSFSSNDNGGIHSQSTFSQWFRDVPGVNMSRPWTLTLTQDASGTFIYDVNDFHPIDYQLLGNGPDEHNFYFTYEICATFVAEPGQFITFTGDDDCWIFVDNRLVIDHGGITANRRQHVTLDRLALTPGETYDLRFFFAERCQPQSQFRLETNIGTLSTGSSVAVLDMCD